jgi:hypothetical protein
MEILLNKSELLTLRPLIFFFQLIAFGLAIIGPWLWLRSDDPNHENQFFLTARHSIQGWQFVPVHLGVQTQKNLGAAELFNGHFTNGCLQRVSVFSANWQPGQGDFSSLGHTPEKCWVEAGFRLAAYDGPSQICMSIGGRKIPFQCRILNHPNLGSPEIALWAACIDGQWSGIPYEPPPEQMDDAHNVPNQIRRAVASYNSRWAFFRNRVFNRLNPAARKQFIRLSTPLTAEWRAAIIELGAFADRWLEPD